MKYDVIVVGGGPAGAVAAKKISEKNFSCLLLEKDKVPRDKPCAGQVRHKANQIVQVPEDIVERHVKSAIMNSPSGEKVTYELTYEDIIVKRSKFDAFLVDEAKLEGVSVVDESKVVDVKISDSSVKVDTMREEYESEIVIAADGVNSTILQKLGLIESISNRVKKNEIMMTISMELEMDRTSIDQRFGNTTEYYFNASFAPYGYGWIFPKKNTINIGLGNVPKGRRFNTFWDLFLSSPQIKEIIQSSKVLTKRGWFLPAKGPIKNTFSDRILAVGDAAGFVDPKSGEGIYFGMKSGEIASTIVENAFKIQKFTKETLSSYKDLWYNDFGKEMYKNLKIAENIYGSDKNLETMFDELKKGNILFW